MTPRVTLLLIISLFFHPLISSATYLSIATQATPWVNEAEKSVKVSFVLRNDGDEVAREVGLSFPSVNRGRILAQELAPKGEVKESITFSFAELGIDKEGLYMFPFHSVYRDSNFYPFSSPQIISLSRGEPPSATLVGHYEGLNKELKLVLSTTEGLSLRVTNSGSLPLKISSISALAANELQVRISGAQVPSELAPSGVLDLELEVKNLSALLDSEYGTWTIMQGEVGGRHFAEAFSYRTRVEQKTYNVGTLMRALIIGLGVVVALLAGIRMFRKNTRFSAEPT